VFSILILVLISTITLAKQKESSIVDLDPRAKKLKREIEKNPEDACLLSEYAAYAAKKAWFDEAIDHYQMALKIKKDDHVLWTNLGSVYVRMGKDSSAISAFKRAIQIEPLHAIAHYNLGAIYDAHNKFDEAVREYKTALTLDPTLANPTVNPLIVNNTLMTVLNMMLYKEREGSLSLPLQSICE
jgi:Flp pilus assembly protein TadD